MTLPATHRGMTMRTPATCWNQALPTGSGPVGAMIYGQISMERVLLNHEDLFAPRDMPRNVDVSAHLPEVRKLIEEGRYQEAREVLPDAYAKATGETTGNTNKGREPVQPLANLLMSWDCAAPFAGYRRGVEFDTGRCWVSWKEQDVEITREVFVSRKTDLVHLRVRSTAPGGVTTRVGLSQAIDEQKGGGGRSSFMNQESEGPIDVEKRVDAEQGRMRCIWSYLAGQPFGAVAQLTAQGGTVAQDEDTLLVEGADALEIRIQLFVGGSPEQAESELEKHAEGFDEAFAQHVVDHQELFGRMELNIADPGCTSNDELLLDAFDGEVSGELVQKMIEMGRYLLVTSSGSGGWPAHLQGVWNGDYAPAWNSDYHTDENIQMNYWQALPGNLPETMMPFFELFERSMDQYRANAKNLYGCRGIFVPISFTTNGYDVPRVWSMWTGSAGWIGQHFYDYYLFTGDQEFLATRAIPFLKEIALFYEDFMMEGEDGKLLFSPSMSPENNPGNVKCLVVMNATMDVAICKEVLTHLCDGCETLGIEEEGVSRWRAMIAKLPPYEINEDGAMKEWLHPWFKDNYHHRHQSQMYPVFPGFEVTKESDPEIFEACRVAVEKRLVIGLTSQTGWSMAHMANIYARLEEGDRALECIEILTRSSVGPNLLTYHNDWRQMGLSMGRGGKPIFQIDANMGISNAAMEMLAFSKPGLIKLLPALPKKWSRGSVRGLVCRGGITLDLAWNVEADQFEAQLVSKVDQQIQLRLPAMGQGVTVEDAEFGPDVDFVKVTLTSGTPCRITSTAIPEGATP